MWWIVAGLLVVLVLLVGWLVFFKGQSVKHPNSSETTNQGQDTPATKPPVVHLQPTVDAWLAGQRADFGIVVYDPANQQVIAQHQPDKKYFAASLYKIFVAYLALVDFQNGTLNPDAMLVNGYSNKECVDKMIRESDSPCGEAMMARMGQDTLRERVRAMGMPNTIFAGITTTAHDTATILRYIVEMRDLNAENTTFLKDAMRVQEQRFRNGLAKGAPQATWETKVGWNETYNYHDIGIMTLPNGRQYVVAILSQGNGSSAPIADFAATIYPVLNN